MQVGVGVVSAGGTALYRLDQSEEAVEGIQSHDIVCCLNGKSINQVKQDLGL